MTMKSAVFPVVAPCGLEKARLMKNTFLPSSGF
jgi:hypothetical protein